MTAAMEHRFTRDDNLYEDFTVGETIVHPRGRTISEADNTWFTLLTMNKHPLHFDNEYASKSEFKQPLVNSCLTLSMVVGMSVSDVSQKAIGNLGWNDIRLSAPVFVGDTIYAESEVLSKRESASRPGQGLVTVRTIGNSDFCHKVDGMPRGGSRLKTRAVAIVCDSVYFSKPSGPCLRPTPDTPIPPIGALRLPQAKA